MSCTAQQLTGIRPYSSSANSVELFPGSIQVALDRIEAISKRTKPNENKPSGDNVEWAKRVLLRVLPRHYLLGAEIDAFECEIHINWDRADKRITAFLPAPNQLKVYCEHTQGTKTEHTLVEIENDPRKLSGVLRWLFS
jgi:hypothetical protein